MAIIPPKGTSAYKAYQRANRPLSPLGAPISKPSSVSSSIPPVGTSAYKAYQFNQRTGNSPSTALSKAGSLIKALSGSGSGGYYGGGAPSGAPVAAPSIDYYNAALAQHYGMDATTAYQEALANTSYQRSVQDMLNAGLNPATLFAAGRVSGADGVRYATQIGDGFIPSSGGSGGGGSARSKYVFGKGLYQALQVVGGGLAVAATKHASAYFAGQSAAKGIMQAINGFFR